MNIAYLSSAEIPSRSANSLQVMKMCEALALEGHAVTLIAPRAAEAAAPPALESAYGVRMNFELRRIRPIALLGRRGLALGAARMAARIRPALTVTRGLDFAFLCGMAGCTVLLEVHHPPTGRLGPLYFQACLRMAGVRIAVISRGLEQAVRSRYGSLHGKALLVAPDAVDTERYANLADPRAARAACGLPAGLFTAGYFGSLLPGRGVEMLVELAERLPEAQFLVAGGDPAQVNEWRARTRAAANVRWLGHLPQDRIPSHQSACDALLMPYQRRVTIPGGGDTAAVMSPLKLYEYMAAGRLILASDLPALRETLHDGNSVLLPPEDVSAWERALREGMQGGASAARCAARAKADVASRTWRNRARALVDFAAVRAESPR